MLLQHTMHARKLLGDMPSPGSSSISKSRLFVAIDLLTRIPHTYMRDDLKLDWLDSLDQRPREVILQAYIELGRTSREVMYKSLMPCPDLRYPNLKALHHFLAVESGAAQWVASGLHASQAEMVPIESVLSMLKSALEALIVLEPLFWAYRIPDHRVRVHERNLEAAFSQLENAVGKITV